MKKQEKQLLTKLSIAQLEWDENLYESSKKSTFEIVRLMGEALIHIIFGKIPKTPRLGFALAKHREEYWNRELDDPIYRKLNNRFNIEQYIYENTNLSHRDSKGKFWKRKP